MSQLPNNIFQGVSGTDGHSPIIDYYSTFHIWHWNELYFGQEGQNKYVPKVNDLVFSDDPRSWYKVTRINEITLTFDFLPVIFSNDAESDNSLNYLVGVGPGQQSNYMRCYVDKTVTPYKLSVDKSLWIGGEDAQYAIIYKGSLVMGGAREPVSLMFDASNQLVGVQVPLELAELTPGSGELKKTVATASTMHDLQDNEPVTIVFYGREGHQVSARMLLIENSAFINAGQNPYEFVEDITLESPWLSPSDRSLIEFPLNLTMDSLNLIGVVQYNSGRQTRIPVDGTRFMMSGIEAMIATVPNHDYPARLVYTLANNELSSHLVSHTDRTINKPYKFRTTQEEGMYSIKLFCYPVWIDQANGYRLQWFLFNLERRTYYEVPASLIQFSQTGMVFDPIAYGARQTLHVTVPLKQINGVYKDVMHAQNFVVTLLKPGDGTGARWNVNDIGYEPYGGTNMAKMEIVNSNLRYINLAADAVTKEEWLSKIYRLANPLYDRFTETKAPEPDRVYIKTSSSLELEISVDDWRANIPINFQIQTNDTLFLRFARRTPDNTLQLGMGAMHIEQVDTLDPVTP